MHNTKRQVQKIELKIRICLGNTLNIFTKKSGQKQKHIQSYFTLITE